ncbi:CBS domain-containing protein [Apibacter raozihei]|uniref:CBS domain-containing protein n=1 Tax=Apibacter TaxID=1778601 RepID=UPI000FE2C01D|nr:MULTISPECIES: CBS domain-containing protein [Apibacter]
MIITNYLSKNIPLLSENDTVKKAKQIMLDLKLTHLSVLSQGKLLGSISFDIVSNLEDDDFMKDHLIELDNFYLYEYATIFDSLRIFSDNETNSIPVIDAKDKLLGIISEEDVVEELASYPFIAEFGVFMTIATPIQKYSISEVANIVESNNGRILGLLVTNTEEDRTYITLKIAAENISSIGDTFERFGYQISNKYFEDSKNELLKDRFDQLQKFMEV